MACGHHKLRGVSRIHRSESVGVARNAGIDFALRRAHREFNHRALGEAALGGHLGRNIVGRADDETAVHVRGRRRAVGHFLGCDIAGSVGITCRRGRALGVLRRRRSLAETGLAAVTRLTTRQMVTGRGSRGMVLFCSIRNSGRRV